MIRFFSILFPLFSKVQAVGTLQPRFGDTSAKIRLIASCDADRIFFFVLPTNCETASAPRSIRPPRNSGIDQKCRVKGQLSAKRLSTAQKILTILPKRLSTACTAQHTPARLPMSSIAGVDWNARGEGGQTPMMVAAIRVSIFGALWRKL